MFSISRPLLIVALVALGVSWVGLTIEHARVKRYQAELHNARMAAEHLTAAYDGAQGTITRLEGAVDAMQDAAVKRQAEYAVASRTVVELGASLRERDRRIAQLEKSDHAIPDCQALLRADLSVCPGYSRGVRERANGGLQGPTR